MCAVSIYIIQAKLLQTDDGISRISGPMRWHAADTRELYLVSDKSAIVKLHRILSASLKFSTGCSIREFETLVHFCRSVVVSAMQASGCGPEYSSLIISREFVPGFLLYTDVRYTDASSGADLLCDLSQSSFEKLFVGVATRRCLLRRE